MRNTVTFGAVLVLFLVNVAVAAEVEHNRLTPEEQAAGWLLLFDGESDFGWRAATKANWSVRDGKIAVSSGEPGLLCTTSVLANFRLKLEFRAAAETNSGVFLRTPERPTNPTMDCYELNIAPPTISPYFTGSLVGRQKAQSQVDASDWQSFEVTAEGGHFSVMLDGKQVLEYDDPNPIRAGLLGLQFNSGQIEFRDLKLLPLGLKPLLNGHDLTGWKIFPGKPSQFSINEAGELTIKNGPGQIETERQFADFCLQLDVFVNGKNLNSGVFFRSIPGELWQGYEAQIQNGYTDHRNHPVDCGTGGFYRRQNARLIVADDFEWFTMTVIASGNHFASWVNGYPVCDWTDTRDADPNPRKGLRREAGTLILQGHDATTDLRFRNFRVADYEDP